MRRLFEYGILFSPLHEGASCPKSCAARPTTVMPSGSPRWSSMSADVLASAELSAEFARWLAAHRTQATELSEAALRPAPAREYLDAQKTLQSWLYDEGWLARGWPKEYGGTGNDIGSRAAVYDLLGAADIAVPSTVNVVEILAPTLQRFAPGSPSGCCHPWWPAPRRGARGSPSRRRAATSHHCGRALPVRGRGGPCRARKPGRRAHPVPTGVRCWRGPARRNRGTVACHCSWSTWTRQGWSAGRSTTCPSPSTSARSSSMTSRFPTSGASATSTAAGRWRSICCSGSAACSPGCARPRCWACSASCRRGRPRPGRGVSGRHRAPAAFAGHPAGTGGRPQRRPAGVDRQAAAVQGRAIRPRAGAPDAARRCRRRNSRLARPGARVPAQQVGADLRGSAEIQRTIIADQILQLREKAR